MIIFDCRGRTVRHGTIDTTAVCFLFDFQLDFELYFRNNLYQPLTMTNLLHKFDTSWTTLIGLRSETCRMSTWNNFWAFQTNLDRLHGRTTLLVGFSKIWRRRRQSWLIWSYSWSSTCWELALDEMSRTTVSLRARFIDLNSKKCCSAERYLTTVQKINLA